VSQSAPLDDTTQITVLERVEGDVLVEWNRQGDPRPRSVAMERVIEEESSDA